MSITGTSLHGHYDAVAAFDSLLALLSSLGFLTRDHVRGAAQMVAVGLVFLGPSRTIANKSERTWRVHFAIKQLLARGFASSHVMQVVVGHIVNLFLLRRCLLSALAEVWTFIDDEAGERELPRAVKAELRVVCYLLFAAVHDAGVNASSRIFVTDSSIKGYAMIEGTFTSEEVLSAIRWKERWKFKENREAYTNTADLSHDSMNAAASAEALAADALEDIDFVSSRSAPTTLRVGKKTVRD